jgi:dCTP diphosphatase
MAAPRSAARDLDALSEALREFRDARHWREFHQPKNLAAAIAVEAAELQELFLWDDPEQESQTVDVKHRQIEEELADILIQCLNFADSADVDVLAACWRKLEQNEEKYPVDRARGSSAKYDEL